MQDRDGTENGLSARDPSFLLRNWQLRARMFELYYRAAALLRLDWILSLANDGGAASLPLHTPRSAHCCAIYSRSIAVVAEQKLHKYL